MLSQKLILFMGCEGFFETVLPQLTVKTLIYQVVEHLVNSNTDLSSAWVSESLL